MLKTVDIAMSFGTYLYNGNPNSAYSASQYVHVWNGNGIYHTLLKPAYSTAIPDYSIDSATLYIYVQYKAAASPLVTLNRVLKAATNGATWNKYDGTNAWETAGGTGATDISAALACSPFSGFIQYQYAAIPLTRAEYLAAKTDDQSFLLTPAAVNQWLYFVNAGQPTNAPFIRIQYRSNSVPTFF